MNHRPTHDWIVTKLERDTRTDLPVVRGVVQPTAEVKPKKYGRVIAVGPGRQNAHGHWIPLPCKVGDLVMIRDVAGEPVIVDGDEYHWCIPDEVMAVVADLPDTL